MYFATHFFLCTFSHFTGLMNKSIFWKMKYVCNTVLKSTVSLTNNFQLMAVFPYQLAVYFTCTFTGRCCRSRSRSHSCWSDRCGGNRLRRNSCWDLRFTGTSGLWTSRPPRTTRSSWSSWTSRSTRFPRRSCCRSSWTARLS